MDGAEACDRYFAGGVSCEHRRVGGRGVCCAAFGASLGETDSSADLGGSSNYSSENLED